MNIFCCGAHVRLDSLSELSLAIVIVANAEGRQWEQPRLFTVNESLVPSSLHPRKYVAMLHFVLLGLHAS